jgi:hypothetical protein
MFGVDTSGTACRCSRGLILFIGPKELPRVDDGWSALGGKFRGYARHFTSGIGECDPRGELEELEGKPG